MTWLIDTLFVTGALIAAVLLLRRGVARLFGPGMAYALWLLPLLRLALPPLVLPAPSVPVQHLLTMGAPAGPPVTAPLISLAWDPVPYLIALWLAGAAVFLASRWLGYARMRRRVLALAMPVRTTGTIRIVESPDVTIPVAFGVFDKVVALPDGFMAGADCTARDLVLAHELEHHAGRDLAMNFAMQPLLALHWFNPLAWIGWHALRRDQEAACDARVLAGCDAATRAMYGLLIARFARCPQPPRAAALACAVITEKSIVHRLRSLTMTEPSPRRRVIGRALIAAAALALPLTASISYAASDNPVASSPPAAPVSPEAITHEKRLVIIAHAGAAGSTHEPGFTRTITRDGKTIVLKTDQPVSDAELEKKLAEIDASQGERRVILRQPGGDGAGSDETVDTDMVVNDACAGNGQRTDVSASGEAGTRHQIVRIRICAEKQARDGALKGLQEARNSIANDPSIADKIRGEVMKELDKEIARLSGQG